MTLWSCSPKVGQFDKAKAEFWTNVQNQSAEERAASFEISTEPQGKQASPSAQASPENPDVDVNDALPDLELAYVALGSNLDDPERQVEPRIQTCWTTLKAPV